MVKIEIWSDINCPFCYIGKRHLEAALESFPNDVHIEWKSFELDPTANPPKGVSQLDLLAQKYGKDHAWALEMNNNMTDMARRAGLDFKMNDVIPANSFNAHRLIHLAKSSGQQDEMKEALLKARFTDGLDIGDVNVLRTLAAEHKIEVGDLFESNRFSEEVRNDEMVAQKIGISGVPFFVFNQKYALSGAQPVEVFKKVLNEVTSSSAS